MFWLSLINASDAASPTWDTNGELRYLGLNYPDLALDQVGTTTSQDLSVEQRLRAGVSADFDGWKALTEWDLATGLVAGDTWGINTAEDERNRDALSAFTLDGFMARQAYMQGLVGNRVQVTAGLVTFNWGLGILANDGGDEPLFGHSDFGDRIIRARAGTRLGAFTVSAAVDQVLADDTARWSEGQRANQGVVAVLHGTEHRAGLFGVYRHQTEPDDEEVTEAWVLDGFASRTVKMGDWSTTLAAEAAAITGSSERFRSYNSREELQLRSAGVAGHAQVHLPEGRVVGHLRGGWASGDGNPDDDVNNAFTFDREYDVGMVLFDEVQGAMDAATYALLEDPQYSGQAPDGAEQLVSEGAVGEAVYVQPAVDVGVTGPFRVRAGAVLAWSTAPVSQGFYTYRAGGVPTNQLGETTNGYGLGTELDWAIRFSPEMKVDEDALAQWKPTLEVQGGHAFLSENLGGGRADLFMASAKMAW